MVLVNTKKAMNKIILGMLKENRARTYITIVTLALTTLLTCIVSCYFIMNLEGAAVNGRRYYSSTADIRLTHPTEEQLGKIGKTEYIKRYGIRSLAALGVIDKIGIELYYSDQDDQEMLFPALRKFEGNYPEGQDEIMISASALKELGQGKLKIGDQVALVLYQDLVTPSLEKTEEMVFTISGIFDGRSYIQQKESAYVSENFFASRKLEGHGQQIAYIETEGMEKGQDVLALRTELDISRDQNIRDISEEVFYEMDQIIVMAVIAYLVILFLEYLLIHNVYIISVKKDIRYYALLKTIGVSRKQFKLILHKQANLLALIGTAAGSLLSIPATVVLVASAAEIALFKWEYAVIYLFSVCFSFLILSVSIHKSIKIANNISPIEAVKFLDKEMAKKSRRKISGVKLARISFYNVFRKKRRIWFAFLSVSIGICLFVAAASFIHGLSFESSLAFRYHSDMNLINYYDETNDRFQLNNQLDSVFMESFQKIEGIAEYYYLYSAAYEVDYGEQFRNYYKAIEGGELYTEESFDDVFFGELIGIDTETLETYYPDIAEDIELSEFEAGKILLLESVYEDYYQWPDQFSIRSVNNEKEIEVEVRYVERVPNTNGSIRHGGGEAPRFVGTDHLVRELSGNLYIAQLLLNVQTGREEQVGEQLLELTMANQNIELNRRDQEAAEAEEDKRTLSIFGSGITLVLLLTGIMNYINVTATSIFARKGELSTLESIGMTRKQIRKMLMGEGGYFGVITTAAAWVISMAVYIFIMKPLNAEGTALEIQPPVVLLGVTTVMILLICITTPLLTYRMIEKESLADRLYQIK